MSGVKGGAAAYAGLGKLSKEEIAGKPLSSDRDKRAFLSALILSIGSLIIHGMQVAVTVSTENDTLADAVRAAAKDLTARDCRVERKNKRIEIVIEDALGLLCSCNVLTCDGGVGVCEHIAGEFASGQSSAAYVRGAYLGAGSLSAGQYHLEFSFGRKSIAEDFSAILHGYGISAGLAVRKSRAVVYVKDSEAISDCLALMGAAKTVLEFNSLLASRQMSEHINRQQNCDMHNIDKQIDTGLKQIAFIKDMDVTVLSGVLRETAEARLAHPDYSYSQLAQLLGITKSGLKNRMRRLAAVCAGDGETDREEG